MTFIEWLKKTFEGAKVKEIRYEAFEPDRKGLHLLTLTFEDGQELYVKTFDIHGVDTGGGVLGVVHDGKWIPGDSK